MKLYFSILSKTSDQLCGEKQSCFHPLAINVPSCRKRKLYFIADENQLVDFCIRETFAAVGCRKLDEESE